MSTKMSNEMHVNRPTTRVYAPPGGVTSFTLGGDDHIVAKPDVESVVDESEPPQVPSVPEVLPANVECVVGLAIAGEGIDHFEKALVNALANDGVPSSQIKVRTVKDSIVLPYLTKSLVKECDIVFAGTILSGDSEFLRQSLTNSLLEVGIQGGISVVPGIVHQDNELEGKVMVQSLAVSWSRSISTLLTLNKQPDTFDKETVDAEAVVATPLLTPVMSDPSELLSVFRDSLHSHGARGIFGIGRKFRIADDNGNGQLEFSEFTKVVSEHTLDWSEEQIKSVFAFFDTDNSGSICFDEFLVGMRGDMNNRRQQLVLQAFEILDADGSGVVEINDIEAKYDASRHPDVVAGKRSKVDVLREFLDTFDVEEKDGKVTPSEFIKYYSNVSASIDNDDYFELMIRNAWHISGGKGWCENSSCRRVLVTHKDGHQSVQEVKDDLGIKADDTDAMMANFAKQGLHDITGIELFGSTKNVTPAAATPPRLSSSEPSSSSSASLTPSKARYLKAAQSSFVFG